MASIVGDKKYHNATSLSGWEVTDKIFGYIDKTVKDYATLRTSGVSYDGYTYRLGAGSYKSIPNVSNIGLFGMQKPWGGVILVGGLLAIGVVIFSAAK